jgi:hypothetical protein
MNARASRTLSAFSKLTGRSLKKLKEFYKALDQEKRALLLKEVERATVAIQTKLSVEPADQ